MIDIRLILQEKYEAECQIDPKKGSLLCTIPTDRLFDALDFLNAHGYAYTTFADKEITFLEVFGKQIVYEIVFIPDEKVEEDGGE